MRLTAFISAALLLGLLGLVVAYLGWRAWENAAGEHQWQQTLSTLREKGDPTSFAALVPSPIPDADNLAALPLFQMEQGPGDNYAKPLKLQEALKSLKDDSSVPPSHWIKGKPDDLPAIQKYLADCFQRALPGQPMPSSMLEQLETLCPALNEVRQAAQSRSGCRFDENYARPAVTWPLSGITEMIVLEKIINLDAIIALHENHSDIALQDIETMLKIDSGLRQIPLLVSGLVAIGVETIGDDAIWTGIQMHAWNEQQLTALQRELGSIDLLSDYQLCMRGEAMGELVPIFDNLLKEKLSFAKLISTLISAGNNNTSPFVSLWVITPPGFSESAKAEGVSLYYKSARAVVDPHTQRLYPEAGTSLVKEEKNISRFSPPHILLRVAAGPVIGSDANFGLGQFHVDAERIALMIERYRIAHGVLPIRLDQLTPYADATTGIPHDLCNGQPLHYSLRTDGTYLLYSDGWNLLDDGGQVTYRADEPKATDPHKGDWVWPQLGHAGT